MKCKDFGVLERKAFGKEAGGKKSVMLLDEVVVG